MDSRRRAAPVGIAGAAHSVHPDAGQNQGLELFRGVNCHLERREDLLEFGTSVRITDRHGAMTLEEFRTLKWERGRRETIRQGTNLDALHTAIEWFCHSRI